MPIRRESYVPITAVNGLSETVHLGGLGLPVGFDLERVTLNLPRVETIARLGDMASMTISGFRGDATDYSYGVGGISGDGVGSAIAARTVSRAKLSDSSITGWGEGMPPGYRWKSGSVKINNAEIEERIKNDGDKWDRGLIDETARAKYMSTALQRGLSKAVHEATFPEGHAVLTVGKSAAWKALETVWWSAAFRIDMTHALVLNTAIDFALPPTLTRFMHEKLLKRELPPVQPSLGIRRHYDRYLGAQALTAISPNLFRVRQ